MTTFSSQNGMEMERTMDLTIQSFTLDQDVRDDLFSYTAPQGLKVVDSFERLLNPDSMVGQTAQNITFTTFAGETLNLQDLRGKVVFPGFLGYLVRPPAAWKCPTSRSCMTR